MLNSFSFFNSHAFHSKSLITFPQTLVTIYQVPYMYSSAESLHLKQQGPSFRKPGDTQKQLQRLSSPLTVLAFGVIGCVGDSRYQLWTGRADRAGIGITASYVYR